MATLITDPELEERVRAQRAKWGGDRFDEVWEGTYMMTPSPNSEHSQIQTRLAAAFQIVLGFSSTAIVHTGINVSDRVDDWRKNYRCPDVAVVMPGGIARDYGAFHFGGPDLVVEIVNPDDCSREKIPFYGQVGVRELLLVDRDPWALALYCLRDGQMGLAGQSRLAKPDVLQSAVLPVAFRLVPGKARPGIEVTHNDGVQKWLA